MIKSKSCLEELIGNVRSFTYYKDSTEIDVCLKEKEECISIRCNTPKCIIINLFKYDKAISFLYRDRKYINQMPMIKPQ